MRASEIKKAIKATCVKGRKQSITPFIIGKPGVGKSHVVNQVARELGLDFVDLRLSQVDNTDLKGIPSVDKDTGTSRWFSPEFLPTVGNKRFENSKGGILFLDEFNRAAPDVVQSAFQLVYDYRVGDNVILDNWFIVAAGNFGHEDGCDVNELDAAMNGRLMYIEFDENINEWVEWAKQNDIVDEVISFVKTHEQYFYKDIDKSKGLAITPRRWAQFSNVISDNKGIMDPKEVTALLGNALIGPATPLFLEHLTELESINGEMILKNYKKYAKKLESFELAKLASIADNMADHLIKRSHDKKSKIKTDELENLNKFMAHLADDHLLGFWKKVGTDAIEILDAYGERFPYEDDKIGDIIMKSYKRIGSKNVED